MKTYVNDMDMRREGYVEGEKRGRAEDENWDGQKAKSWEQKPHKRSFCRR